MSEKHIGEVVQVIGPVLDIRFAHDELPPLLNAIEIDNDGAKLVAEVAQQIGDDVVRCIAMNSTDGLVRGAKALDTGGPISVPVGEECLGRVFNLLGDPVTGEDGIIIGWFSVKILKISGYGVAGSRSHASSHIEGIPEPKVNQSSGGDSCYNCTDIAVTECV